MLSAIFLGVYANKFIGGSVLGILNILFVVWKWFLYATFELFCKINF